MWGFMVLSVKSNKFMPKNKDYDKRIFRLLSVLNKLNGGGKVSCREIAGEFNVSLRTIQRDLEILDRTGFLLTSLEKGVWAFAEGFSLRKIRLTAEEASLLGFLGDISSSLGGKFEGSFQNILKKLLQQEYDSPFYVKMPQGIGIGKDAPFVTEIEGAVGENRKILLKYRHSAKAKIYKLCPLKIVFYEGFWYLIARAEGRDCLLKFRLERIAGVDLLDEYFEEPANLKAMLEESVNVWFSERRQKKVVLKVDKDAAPFFRQKRYFPLQKIKKENKDGSLIVETTVCDDMEVLPAVKSWIPHIIVIQPVELNRGIKKFVERYLRLLQG